MTKRAFLLVIPIFIGLAILTGVLAPRFVPKLNRPKPATILLYNHIAPNFPEDKPFWERYYYLSTTEFDKQLGVIEKRGFAVLSVQRYIDIATNKAPRPKNPLLIIFRDANADIATDALPILQKHHLPAIVFYQPTSRGKEGFLTDDQIKLLGSNGITVMGADFSLLNDPSARQEVSGVIKQAQFEDLLPPKQHDTIAFALVAGLFAAIATGFAIAFPKWSLLLPIILLPTYLIRFAVFGIPATFLELTLVAIITGNIVASGRRMLAGIRAFPFLPQAILLFAAAVISTVFASDKMAALGGLKAYIVEPILFGYLVYFWHNNWLTTPKRESVLAIFAAYSLTASLISLIAFKNFVFGNAYINFSLQKLTTFFGNPNYLATYLTIAITFGLYLILLQQGKWWKWFGLFTLVATVPSFILARSDMGTLGLAAAFGLLLLYKLTANKSVHTTMPNHIWSNKKITSFYILSVIIASFLLFLLVINPRTLPAFQKLHLSTLVSRHCIYQTAGTMVKEHPVTGVGLLNFNRVYIDTVATDCPEQNVALSHDTLLDFATQLGVLGAAAYIWLIIRMLRLTLPNQDRPLAKLLLALFLVLLIHGALDSQYHKNDYAVIWWMLLGLSATLDGIGNEQKTEQQ